MNVSVIDSCYKILGDKPQPYVGAGASYVRWELRRHGITEVSPFKADVLLVSAVAPIEYKHVRRIRKLFPDKMIIVGGAGATCPKCFEDYADCLCLGDGQAFFDELFGNGVGDAARLPNVWQRGGSCAVTIDQNFPWNMPPVCADNGIVEIPCGRGCKNKCFFCHTTWTFKYQEHPCPQEVIDNARRMQAEGQKFSYLSNDVMQHSFFARLPHTSAGSYSIAYLRHAGLPPARQVRLGVEGVSERLREAVNKPITHDDLVQCTSWLNANGKSVRWFMICGLPYETAEDWDELKRAIRDWKMLTPKGTLEISFTAFIPEPSTPMAYLPISDDYYSYYRDFAEWFFNGRGWSNRIKLYKPKGIQTRNEAICAHMGKSLSEIYNSEACGGNERVMYLLTHEQRHAVAARYKDVMQIRSR